MAYRKRAPRKNRSKPKSRAPRRRKGVRRNEGYLSIHRLCNEQKIINGTTPGITNMLVNGVGPVSIAPTSETTPFTNYCNVLGAAKYSLSDIPSSSDITNLCDEYRIKAVKHVFTCTSTDASINGQGQMPSLVWSYDDDDTSIPISAQSLKLKQSVKMAQLSNGKQVTIWVKPKMLSTSTTDTSAGLAPTAPNVVPSQWINSTYPAAQHYGLKFAIQDALCASNVQGIFHVKVNTTYYIEGKGFQ